ncbi:glycosyltransferase [Glutamicibacter ardleyensis]|uniref:glycosyltransferase n=1 Tax=Glutamicibacter ardleyensis TaxID=225894 RepID=UPI003FD2D4ED
MNESTDRSELVQTLLKAGIFDRHWYSAQSDRYFRSWQAAAADYISYGMSQGYSPHPLMDVQSWPGHLREAWRHQKLTQVLAWFRGPLESQPKIGPLLVPSLLNTKSGVISAADVAAHPGGTLGWLLENAPDEYVVDFPEGHWVWGDVIRGQQEVIGTLKKHTYSSRPRMQTTWDFAVENSWKKIIRATDLQAEETDQPLVSIIMPAWNRADTISKAIRSIQRQTLSNWELIVVDDGSTDSTREVVNLLANVDSRIQLKSAKHNGVSAARNVGLHEATGRWVSFLDTDNEWPEDYLELSIKGAVDSKCRAVYSGLELHNGGKVSYRAYRGGLPELMILNHIDLNVFTVDRALAVEIGGFDEALRRWVDHDFAIRIAKVDTPVLLPFIGCRYWDERESAERITTSEAEAWQWVVLGKNLVDWKQMDQRATVPGRVTVSMPVYQDWQMTVRAVRSVLENSGQVDIEVVIVDNGSSISNSIVLGLLYTSNPQVKYVRLARNLNFAIGSNYGAFLGTGEYTCFLNNDTLVRDGWIEPMIERLRAPDVLACQPLLQYPDDSIQTAGTVFMQENRLPGHFLANHPPEDASSVVGNKFSAITGACMLWRTSDVLKYEGFDPFFVNGMEDIDLCLRAAEATGGHFVVEPGSRVTHFESKTPGRGRNIVANRQAFMARWNGKLPSPNTDMYVKAGFELAHVGGDQNLIPSPRPVVYRPQKKSRLRWGIRYAAIGGARGDRWGDTHYVGSLSDSLRALGHEVVTYRHGHNKDSSQCFDDINLVIRGLDRIAPIPGAVNILWVISHPEDVTVEEIRSYDLVYGSSSSWSKRMAEISGVDVRTLLQATDTRSFHLPKSDLNDRFRPTTFVGANTRNRKRLVITDALTSGIDLRIIGHGWDDVLEPNMHEAEGIDNRDLADFYRSSKRILADHWVDMAEEGFIQNRIFDAVACGTPVISDKVIGLNEVFGSMVQTYDSLDELRWLCSPEGLREFGSSESRIKQSQSVIENHSFDARAKTLTNDVQDLR